MTQAPSFDDRVSTSRDRLSPADLRAVQFFQDNRAEVMVASASALAAKIGTSDATVIRAARALGYAGLEELRRHLAEELRQTGSPAERMVRTLKEIGGQPQSALGLTIDLHIAALESLRRDISPALFQAALDKLAAAQRVFVFGIGPSGALAEYFATQLGRFGVDAGSLTQTGILLADRLLRLRRGDLVVVLAYGRLYPELESLLAHASRLGLTMLLLTDTLGAELRRRVGLVLPVARGRTDSFSMHTTTLGLIEALLVGLAARQPERTVASLDLLNDLRANLVGRAMDLPNHRASVGPERQAKRRRRAGMRG